jgi:hypothetical protein
MGGDLSGRNGSGTEKYFPSEIEAMERDRKRTKEEVDERVKDALIPMKKKMEKLQSENTERIGQIKRLIMERDDAMEENAELNARWEKLKEFIKGMKRFKKQGKRIFRSPIIKGQYYSQRIILTKMQELEKSKGKK